MKNNNNLLFVLPNDKLGGAEQHLKNLVFFFSKSFNQINIVFLKKRDVDAWNDLPSNVKIEYSSFNTEKGGIFFLIKKIYKISKKNNIDYTFSSHTHINGFLGFLRFLKIFKTDKLIVRESTTILTRFAGLKLFLFKMQYLLGYRYNDLVICQTDKMKNELEKYLHVAKKWKRVVIQNPVDLNKIAQLSYEKITLPFESEFIVTAGRLIQLKGFDILIEAFSKITKKYKKLNLIILGEGEEKNNLQSQIKRHELSNRIKLLGHVNNPIPYFKAAKVCVVSSLVEGFPNVLLQMMSQNSRVVSTTCAGGIDKIEGLFTCEPKNVTELANVINNALNFKDVSEIRKKYDIFLSNNTVEKYVERIISHLNAK